MEGNTRPRFTPKQKAEVCERWRNGQCIADIARQEAQIAELRRHGRGAARDAFVPRLAIDHGLRRHLVIEEQGPFDGVPAGHLQIPPF